VLVDPAALGRGSSAAPRRSPARSRAHRRRPRVRAPAKARHFRSSSDSRQDWARTPSTRPTSSFLSSCVARMITSRHWASTSSRPVHMLLRPGVLEPPDGGGREPADVLAEQRNQDLVEIARRDALEVEDRDQHLKALRPERIGRQDRRGQVDALAAFAGAPRTRGQHTATGPISVMISRSGK
jgi:hypothetical protein